MSNAAHHSFGRLAFPFVTPVFPWLGKNKSTSRSHFKPLTLQMRNPRKSTLSARCSTICFTLLCLLSLPAISFPQHTSLKFLSLPSHGHFSCSIQPGPPPCQTPRIILSPHYFLKTTQQHQQNWPLISSWDTVPTSPGFPLSDWCFCSFPPRPLSVRVLQGPIPRPPFHWHSLSQEITKCLMVLMVPFGWCLSNLQI